MSKSILKAVIFMAAMGLGVNLYAQTTEEDIQYAQERLAQEKSALRQEKSQVSALFKEVREIIKAADYLKKENAGLRADLTKIQEIKAKLESDTREISLKNQELERVTKKDVLKQDNLNLKTELMKLKEAKDKLESATKELSLKNQEFQQTIKKDDLKQEITNLKAELSKQKDQSVKIQELELAKKDALEAAEGIKKEDAGLKAELTKLKDFNGALQKKAEDLYVKNQELAPAKEEARSLGSMVEYLNRERQALKKMNEQLRQDMITLQDNMRKEKAALYEELGTSYVQSKLYDLAIDTYEKSVKLVPGNAEVYYNLGLLYKLSQSNRDKAIHNFKRYLDLNPKAKNRKEVEYFIQMLAEAPARKIGLW